MSVHPGYSGQPFLPESLARLERLRELAGEDVLLQVDGGIGVGNVAEAHAAGADVLVAGAPSSPVATRPPPTPTLSGSPADARQLERALELAERGRGTTRPNPPSAPSSWPTARWRARAGTSARGCRTPR